MVPAQSRNMDQVRIVAIRFYILLGQRLILILNLAVCLFDRDVIFWSVEQFKCTALNDN